MSKKTEEELKIPKKITEQEKNMQEGKLEREQIWRPMLIGNRMRTTSEDSADAIDDANNSLFYDDLERPLAVGRKASISEMFLGNRNGRRLSSESDEMSMNAHPITDDPKLREFLRRHRSIIDDQA